MNVCTCMSQALFKILIQIQPYTYMYMYMYMYLYFKSVSKLILENVTVLSTSSTYKKVLQHFSTRWCVIKINLQITHTHTHTHIQIIHFSTSSTAEPAAHATGLPPNVLKCVA